MNNYNGPTCSWRDAAKAEMYGVKISVRCMKPWNCSRSDSVALTLEHNSKITWDAPTLLWHRCAQLCHGNRDLLLPDTCCCIHGAGRCYVHTFAAAKRKEEYPRLLQTRSCCLCFCYDKPGVILPYSWSNVAAWARGWSCPNCGVHSTATQGKLHHDGTNSLNITPAQSNIAVQPPCNHSVDDVAKLKSDDDGGIKCDDDNKSNPKIVHPLQQLKCKLAVPASRRSWDTKIKLWSKILR